MLYHFGKGSDGAKPQAGPIVVNGTFYRTTEAGGSSNQGTVYAHYPPNQFALDSHEKYLYVAIQGKTLPEVTVYDYATGELAWTVKKGLSPYASGVALRPAAPQ